MNLTHGHHLASVKGLLAWSGSQHAGGQSQEMGETKLNTVPSLGHWVQLCLNPLWLPPYFTVI